MGAHCTTTTLATTSQIVFSVKDQTTVQPNDPSKIMSDTFIVFTAFQRIN